MAKVHTDDLTAGAGVCSFVNVTTTTKRAWMARCCKCSTPRLIPAGTEVSMWQHRPSVRCPECDSSMHAKLLNGRVTDTPCDARCEGATGHVCECSCGGKNHGVSHAA